ncbi:hypothetical protein ACPVPU_12595 [Sphingomonas sp. CJ99]
MAELEASFGPLFDKAEFQQIAAKWDDWRDTFRIILFAGTHDRVALADIIREMDRTNEPPVQSLLDGLEGLGDFIDNARNLIRLIQCRAMLATADASGVTMAELFAGEREAGQ